MDNFVVDFGLLEFDPNSFGLGFRSTINIFLALVHPVSASSPLTE
jgi:hypothetical protein